MQIKSIWPEGCFLTYRNINDWDWMAAPMGFYAWNEIEILINPPRLPYKNIKIHLYA